MGRERQSWTASKAPVEEEGRARPTRSSSERGMEGRFAKRLKRSEIWERKARCSGVIPWPRSERRSSRGEGGVGAGLEGVGDWAGAAGVRAGAALAWGVGAGAGLRVFLALADFLGELPSIRR